MMNSTMENANGSWLISQASTFLSFKIGYVLNKYYFPIFTPIGVLGNILSFLVMIQKQNRHMSMSLYLATLAVTDTIVLVSGFTTYLAREHHVEFPSNQYWYCSIIITVLGMSMFCGSLLLVAMTFGRFYSIIRPHKAASFNTVKRTRILIIIAVLFSVLFNIPNFFISDNEGWECMPFAKAGRSVYGKVFYWFALMFEFVLPFVLLLGMNTVIIHTLHTRFIVTQGQDKESGKIETAQRKSSDTQIFIMLLLVTFGFLILVTPAYVFFLYAILVNYLASAESFAGYYLFHSVAQKFRFSNHGVNFFFYVISGEKFRTDLRNLTGFSTKFDKKEARQTIQTISK